MRKAIRTIVATAATTTLAVAALVPAAHAADSTGVEAVADFVSDVAPITFDTQVWNIDTWRPHVSYTKMIEKRCNP